ncbi:hypothetical protein F4805DRAFT_297599 [Annulohypoxylon moriforme]|nr:hypothetical protein F4805DRAFT_297599 [Annulohypoxylon moriforme]
MAEIPNSDSPDPLSSTPPRSGRFIAPSTISIPSTPSTNSDLRSLVSGSPNRQTRTRTHAHQHRRLSSWNNTSPAPSVTPPPMDMAFNNGDIVGFMRAVEDEFDPLFDPRGLEEEEHLFVSDDDNDDHDYNDDEYDDDGLSLVEERNVRPGHLDGQAWVDVHSDDSFEENQFLGRANHQRNAGNNPRLFDELVEMELAPVRNTRGNQGHQQQQRQEQQPRAQPEVIDLTGDSPTQPARPAPRNHSQNTRRQQSQQRNAPPRLARSDASYMESHDIIDLVSDSEDDRPARIEPARRAPAAQAAPNPEPPRPLQPRDFPPPPRPLFGLHNGTFGDIQQYLNQMPIIRMIARNHDPDRGRDEEDLVIMGQRNLAPNAIPAPNLPPINLDVRVHPFANIPHVGGGPGAKPAHEPPKETREGFTRDTGEDVVAICPSCELELAYDPDDDDSHQGPPAKKARTKKDKAEHHFWAVKACGHVYCRACYENRKPVGKHPVPVGFRREPNGLKNHVLCAVDDCETDVSAKSAWVGIFM